VIESIIDKVLKPVLIGKDPRNIEDLWEECYFRAGVKAFGSRGIGVMALGGIDIALWDIRGKIKKLPLCRLLTDTPRERVEVYATALYPDETHKVVQQARALAAEGFRGVKIKLGFNFAKDMEIVKAVRKELGDDFAIMTDANMGYEVDVAMKAVAVLGDSGVAWLEEPLFVENIAGHASLRFHSSKVPIAVGENLQTCFAFQQYISQGAVDVLQPDVARAGGVSETLKIAALAVKHGLPLALHNWGDAVTLAVSLHLAAALNNSSIMEFDCTYNPLRTELLRESLEPKNGTIAPPSGPGLGIDLSTEALKKYFFAGEEEINFRQKAINAI